MQLTTTLSYKTICWFKHVPGRDLKDEYTMDLVTSMKPEIRKWFQKGSIEDQKGYPRNVFQQWWKKSYLPPVHGNIRMWRIGPLGPWELGGNIKTTAKWHKRVETVDKENRNTKHKTWRGLTKEKCKNIYTSHSFLYHKIRTIKIWIWKLIDK